MHKFTNNITNDFRYFLQYGYRYYDYCSQEYLNNNFDIKKNLLRLDKFLTISRFFLYPFIYIISLIIKFKNNIKISIAKTIGIIILLLFVFSYSISSKIFFLYLVFSFFILALNIFVRFLLTRKIISLNKRFLETQQIPLCIKEFLSSSYNQGIFQIINKNQSHTKSLVDLFLKWSKKSETFNSDNFIKLKFSEKLLRKIAVDYNTSYLDKYEPINYQYTKQATSSIFFNQLTLDMIFIYDFSLLSAEEKNNLTLELHNLITHILSQKESYSTSEISHKFIEPYILSKERALNLVDKIYTINNNENISQRNKPSRKKI